MIHPNPYDAVLGGDKPAPVAGAVLGTTNRYKNPDHRQFCLDMAASQLPVRHYEGRFFWSGPAVDVRDIQDALSFTRVKCLWDESGRDWIVYPKAYRQESIAIVRELLVQNQLQIPNCLSYSECHKRQITAFVEMIESEFNLVLVK